MSKLFAEVSTNEVKVIVRRQVEPYFKDGWGEAIKDIREEQGLSQQEVADELKISKATVSRWEHEISMPNAIYAIKLSRLLKVDLDTIFDI